MSFSIAKKDGTIKHKITFDDQYQIAPTVSGNKSNTRFFKTTKEAVIWLNENQLEQ